MDYKILGWIWMGFLIGGVIAFSVLDSAECPPITIQRSVCDCPELDCPEVTTEDCYKEIIEDQNNLETLKGVLKE